MKNYNGVININKSKGMTSHKVVSKVRKILGKVKAGHTGTLDPDATGVLPICVGKSTKISEDIMVGDKIYEAELILGIKTDTQDISGEVLEKKEVNVTKEEIEKVIKSFIGEIEQIPPMYSAIKVNGKKLYEYARENVEVVRKSRKVTIHDIEILENNKIRVKCTKGTYIRTLCNDIGEKLGTGGVMGELLRVQTGNFHIDNSITLEQLEMMVLNGEEDNVIIPVYNILNYKHITVLCNKYLYNGNKLSTNFITNGVKCVEGEKYIVFDEKEVLIGIYIAKEGMLKPEKFLYN